MSDIVQTAEAMLEGVTDGPWFAWRLDEDDEPLSVVHEKPIGTVGKFSSFPKIAEEVWADDDAEFIAWCRSGVPALIAALKQARMEAM